MQAIEIILLVCGALAFVISFFLPDRSDGEEAPASLSQEELRALLEDELEASRGRIEDMTEETMTYALEKAERSLDRISNEKMLAFGEYSDSVLDQIGKNQQESVFLHDMLNKNKDELTELLNRADSASKDANLRANEAYDLAGSAKALAQEAYEQAEDAGRNATVAEERMLDARKRLDTAGAAASVVGVVPGGAAAPVMPSAAASMDAETVPGSSVADMALEETTPDASADEEAAGTPYSPVIEAAGAEMSAAAEAIAEVEADEPEEEIEEPPHRMTAMERIAALKSRPERVAEPVETPRETVSAGTIQESQEAIPEELPMAPEAVLPDVSVVEELLNEEKAESAAAVAALTAEPVEKPKAKRAPRRSAAKGATKSAQMSLAELEPVTLQFAPGNEMVNNNQKILEMHKLGRSNMAIAKELGLGLGEVKLVIDLFENS